MGGADARGAKEAGVSRLQMLAARLAPAPLRRWLGRRLHGRLYRGDYPDWPTARAAARGYDDAAILERVIAATRAVRDGEAAWERDTVLFREPERNERLWPVLREAAESDAGRLRVLDVGGALGSVWWQHRRWLAELPEVRWCVVEQPAFVTAGRREFAGDTLQFHEGIDEAIRAERPNLILLSSVLPYVERPHALLASLADGECARLAIDRTGFTTLGRDRITVQHVPASIYEASYPCRLFDRAGLLAALGPRWRVADEWPSVDGSGPWFDYRGLWLRRDAPGEGGR